MSAVRWALVTLTILGVYHALRFAATQCTGGGCDTYIPLSVLVPIAGWISAVITGLFARRASGWTGPFTALTAIVVVGPIVSLIVLRDSPDLFVLVGTMLLAVVPVVTLVSVFAHRPR